MSWIVLLVPVTALIAFCWPIGVYHQWSFFWIAILIVTLIAEAWSKWFTPDKQTISNVMRDYRKKHPVWFWLIMTSWLLFSWALIVHLAT